MTKLNAICVFCGSSEGNDEQIIEDGRILGQTLAKRGISLVYGAAHIGIMGVVAEAALNSKGHVVGVIPEFLKKKEVVHLGLPELITTQNMHQRKLKMHDLSDGFIALPGGMGTLEELFEMLTWLQLGLHAKPIGLLNSSGFFDPLLQQLELMVKTGFLKYDNFALLLVDETIDGLLEKMEHFKRPEVPKWLSPDRT